MGKRVHVGNLVPGSERDKQKITSQDLILRQSYVISECSNLKINHPLQANAKL